MQSQPGGGPPPSPAPKAPETDEICGRVIGGYKIEKIIGAGSMGKVYHARNAAKGEVAAIKIMAAHHAQDEEMLQRFEREARVGQEIQHKNVMRVFGAGRVDTPEGSAPYMIMELIDGPSLEQMLEKRGALDARTALQWMRQVAEGLKAATEKKCIHRDIKPGNIMVTSRMELKVVDFGIARAHSSNDSLRTAVGVVVGSPQFMAPEQAASSNVDHRADIYSLGATFYYALTGRPPYDGRNILEIARKQASGNFAPIGSINSNIPNRVADLIHQMFENQPDNRFQTYDELIGAIDDAIAGRDRPKPAPKPAAQPASAPDPSGLKRPSGAQPGPRPGPRIEPPSAPINSGGAAPLAEPRHSIPYQAPPWYKTSTGLITAASVVLLIAAAVVVALNYL